MGRKEEETFLFADLFFLTKPLFEYVVQFRAKGETPEEMKQWAE